MDNSDYASVDLYEFDGEYWGNTDFWYFDAQNGETVHEVWFEAGDYIVINSKEELRFSTWWDECNSLVFVYFYCAVVFQSAMMPHFLVDDKGTFHAKNRVFV